MMGVVIGAPVSDLVTIEAANIWGKLFHSRRLFILDYLIHINYFVLFISLKLILINYFLLIISYKLILINYFLLINAY